MERVTYAVIEDKGRQGASRKIEEVKMMIGPHVNFVVSVTTTERSVTKRTIVGRRMKMHIKGLISGKCKKKFEVLLLTMLWMNWS